MKISEKEYERQMALSWAEGVAFAGRGLLVELGSIRAIFAAMHTEGFACAIEFLEIYEEYLRDVAGAYLMGEKAWALMKELQASAGKHSSNSPTVIEALRKVLRAKMPEGSTLKPEPTSGSSPTSRRTDSDS